MSDLSPAPGTPQTATKAWWATGLTFAVAFVTFWVADDDPFTAKEAAQGVVSALIASGLVGGTAYQVPNRVKKARTKVQ